MSLQNQQVCGHTELGKALEQTRGHGEVGGDREEGKGHPQDLPWVQELHQHVSPSWKTQPILCWGVEGIKSELRHKQKGRKLGGSEEASDVPVPHSSEALETGQLANQA